MWQTLIAYLDIECYWTLISLVKTESGRGRGHMKKKLQEKVLLICRIHWNPKNTADIKLDSILP